MTRLKRAAPAEDVFRSAKYAVSWGLILNWFRSHGFRTFEGIETALYHTLGAHPEPEFTHEFC
jgi:hypothetical protein